MKFLHVVLSFLLLYAAGNASAQIEPPNEPDLYYVTVDPETGNDIIVWLSISTPPNFTYYVVGISVILNPTEPYVAQPIGQVFPPNTMYVNTNTESDQHSVGYTVWAVNDLGGGSEVPGMYEEPDSTIFLQVEFDSCQSSITLSWNDYNKWRGEIEEYNIYRRVGPGSYVHMASLQEGINTYTRNQLQADQYYDLFVEAVHIDGRTSTSNMVQVFTDMTPGPDYINANYATISPGNNIDLSFTVGSSGSFQYNILRSSSETGPFSVINSFDSQDSIIQYTDQVPFQSGIYYYRLEALNNCGLPSTSSNLANNILLNGTLDNLSITLIWNSYYDWNGGVQNYTITRLAGTDNPIIATFDAGLQTGFMDDISGLIDYDNPLSNRICYQIEATENLNAYNMQGKSTSNQLCFSVNAGIRVPNAMIPNDTEPVNRLFEPVFAFIPERYELLIYNRLGLKIWEGSGPWDGKVNGEFVPEGVYLYYIRIFNYATDIFELSGKLTVVYR